MLAIMSNLNDFNSKVNLGKVIQEFGGYDNYAIQNILPFGEFVYNADYSFVGNIFDILVDSNGNRRTAGEVFKYIVLNCPEFLKHEVVFNEYRQKMIQQEDNKQKLWAAIVTESQVELKEHKYIIPDVGKTTLAQYFEKQGNTGIIENGFGHLSIDIKNKYNTLDWTKLNNFSKPIIVPYYHTPKHLSYIEVFDALEEDCRRKELYRSNFNGWVGIKNGCILPDFKHLKNRAGCLWNYTLDHWTNETITIDYNCSINLLLEIFKTAKFTKFEMSPVELIKERHLTPLIYNNLRNLRKEHILVLQDQLELSDLLSEWRLLQSSQYHINNMNFYKRPEGYFVNYKGEEKQLTNFVLTLKSRVKKDKLAYYVVEAEQGNKNFIFEIPETKFNSINKLKNFIREEFLNANLDMPKFFNTIGEKRLMNFIFDWFENENI